MPDDTQIEAVNIALEDDIPERKEKITIRKRIEETKAKLLIHLEASLGIITTACHKAGIERKTFYNYLNTDHEFAKAVNDIKEIKHDFVESKLMKNIEQGKEASIIFYAKTQMRHRGYVERVENVNLNLNHELLNKDPALMTPDELETAIATLEAQARAEQSIKLQDIP